MKSPLCIYHGGCDDGFGAAWIVRKALGDEVEFYPGVYQKDPPDVTDRHVLMVDFSYKKPVLDEVFRKANSLLVLDHHKTAAEDLAGYRAPFGAGWQRHLDNVSQDACENVPQPYALFDMDRSGAGIAWDFFFPDRPRPTFVNYLEDRDLWRKALPNGDEFTIALRSYPQEFDLWNKLADDVSGLIMQGATIQRYYRLRIEELKRHAYAARLGQDRCYISNAPYFAASEVAGELCDRGDASFGACYFEVSAGRFQYSLRSRGDFDVSAVARRYGGGGHKNAAGFSSDDGPVHITL
jgi:oligoribonuclease NrnB/cAMP/cGMP phosphodiesterase (DHH superfamily)